MNKFKFGDRALYKDLIKRYFPVIVLEVRPEQKTEFGIIEEHALIRTETGFETLTLVKNLKRGWPKKKTKK